MQVTYAGRTIDGDRFAEAKYVLERLVSRGKANMFADTVSVDGITAKVEDIDTVLNLASHAFYKLSQEQKGKEE
jgi:hypothetical protein